jgi:hypothetical protein
MKFTLNACLLAAVLSIIGLITMAYDWLTLGYGLHPAAAALGSAGMVAYMWVVWSVRNTLVDLDEDAVLDGCDITNINRLG